MGSRGNALSLEGIAWLTLVVAMIAGVLVAWREGWIALPRNALPWQTPDLTQPPGWFAHLQMDRLAADPEACRAVLAKAGVGYTSIPDRRTTPGCGYTDAVFLDKPLIAFNRRTPATCGMAAALTWYEHEVDAVAEQSLGRRVVRITQLGTYACRNVNAAADRARSEHATANAMDIAGFVLDDGRVVSVARDFNMATPEGRFLAGAHAAACRIFNVVLGPDFNTLHADHFHVDQGRYRICS